MADHKTLTLRERVALKTEAVFMTSMVPKDRVGGMFGLLFKIPLLLQRLGLAFLIPRNILILTTTGRRTGLPRRTPMEFSPGPVEGVYLVMSGWEGRTDWYRNARANPRVRVWMRTGEWDAIAEPVPDEEVARLMMRLTQLSPATARMWSRWSDAPVDGTEGSFMAAARHFPSLYLRPVKTDPANTPPET